MTRQMPVGGKTHVVHGRRHFGFRLSPVTSYLLAKGKRKMFLVSDSRVPGGEKRYLGSVLRTR